MATASLDLTFAALADPTRRAILARLRKGDATVAELAQPFAISQPAISRHLKVLQLAGLISQTRQAQSRPCRIEIDTLAAATLWLDGYRELWEENFMRLDAVLEQMAARKPRASRPASRKK